MAIATPIWKTTLTPDEHAFLTLTERSNPGADRWFLAPESLDLDAILATHPGWQVMRFPDAYFASVRSYSLWLTEPGLYEAFGDHELLTICQTDAFLIRELTPELFHGIDYVGSPWDPPLKSLVLGSRVYIASAFERPEGFLLARWFGRSMPVGNGGLSTRRVRALIDLTRWVSTHISARVREHTLEDALLCAIGSRRGLRIMSAARAGTIYCETGVRDRSTLPDAYGFHGLRRWNAPLAEAVVASVRSAAGGEVIGESPHA